VTLTTTPIGSAMADATTGDAVVTIGTPTSLTLTLVNNSGADIALLAGPQPSAFAVYAPAKLFASDRVREMHVAAAGWNSSIDAHGKALTIFATTAATWVTSQKLTLSIAGVVVDGPPAAGMILIAPSNMKGNVPPQVQVPLAVAAAPPQGSLPLDEVLQVSLASQGVIYRSESADPLTNTLFLNLKNISDEALSSDGAGGSPEVQVSFVYGDTSGALAPDDGSAGSAWGIKVSVPSAQQGWGGFPPTGPTGSEPPHWTLRPSGTNKTLLGPARSDTANATFAFSNIASLTPFGHTQMIVFCTGFRKDAKTAYTDHLYVLDIVKQDPPLTRGLLSFHADHAVMEVSDPKVGPSIQLHWGMFYVSKVLLIASTPAAAAGVVAGSNGREQRLPITTSYPNLKPLDYGAAELKLPRLHTSQPIFLTLQAYDSAGTYLNGLQFTAYAELQYVVDAGGRAYRTALIGDTYWMLEDWAFDTDGSWIYGDGSTVDPSRGRMYDWEAAQAHVPDGWALPDNDDWNALNAQYGGGEEAFRALIAGGTSHFDAQLGGQRTLEPAYDGIGDYGYYWAAEGHVCAQFSAESSSLSTGTAIDPGYAISVRYVRHA